MDKGTQILNKTLTFYNLDYRYSYPYICETIQKQNKMKKYNYEQLMEQQPISYGAMLNSKGQEIDFLEHPRGGGPIICACHELKIAVDSTFFDTRDMTRDKEYEPTFEDGILLIGGYADSY